MFLKFVDASNKVKSGQIIFEMMKEVVQEVGEENSVPVFIDKATNYIILSRPF
jgi:hypothetical protein